MLVKLVQLAIELKPEVILLVVEDSHQVAAVAAHLEAEAPWVLDKVSVDTFFFCHRIYESLN